MQEEENRCPSPLDCSLPSKEVTIRLEENSTYDHYIYVAFGTIVVYAVLFVITIAISYVEFNYNLSSFEELDAINKEKKVEESYEMINETIRRLEVLRKAFGLENKGKEENAEDQLYGVSKKLLKHQKVVQKLSSNKSVGEQQKTETIEMDDLISDDLFIDLDQLDGLGVEVNEENKIRLKRDLTIADLSQKLKNRKS